MPRNAPDKRPVYVYRMYADDDLLYIGCTVRLWTRMAEHRRRSWWSPSVTKVRAKLAPDLAVGRKMETAAIWRERPLWNLKDLSRLIPTWSEDEFAKFAIRWLTHYHNEVQWSVERGVSRLRFGDGGSQFGKLLRMYRLHNGRDFNLSLLNGCGVPIPDPVSPPALPHRPFTYGEPS